MAIELKMPALSPTMEEGTLAKWLVKEGDTISSGDILAEIETDKATMEFEAVDEGIMSKILVPEGTDGVAVGTVIAEIKGDDENDEATEAPKAAEQAKVQKDDKPEIEKAAPTAPVSRASDPDIPEGTKMISLSVREALRDAMAEEMRADQNIFVMGEEVAEYQGAYKVTQGLLQEFGSKRVIDTPITEHGFAGVGTGAAMGGLSSQHQARYGAFIIERDFTANQ